MNHTPGPWEAFTETSSYVTIGHPHEGKAHKLQRPEEIAYTPVCRVNKHAQWKENAALIEAAPNLLAACNAAYECIDGLADQQAMPDAWYKPTLDLLHAAIAKAHPQQPAAMQREDG